MRRITAAAISLLCFVNTIYAQDGLIIQGVSPNLYITHKAAAKENYYSLGRKYNIAPKEIAAYNKLVFENGLNLGQAIRIPLTPNNFTQATNAGSNSSSMPVYHIVEAKEGLYRVSVNYNKVPLEQLKKWNNLSSDAVSNGSKLIVGYLKFQDESQLAKNDATNNKEVAAVTKNDQSTIKKNTTEPEEIIPEIKPDPTKSSISKVSAPEVIKNNAPETQIIPASHTSINFSGGAFKKLYDDQHASKTPVTESGLSGVFKSTSGWRDGKYYCFHNSAPAGSILKITNLVNSKSIYAKVLDLIPDISQNEGLMLHLSNAAAEELGVNDTRFNCSINYAK
ncbi:MAG: LysM peptidoglycan-binding domain-containing protein [Ginsengibacter sp.]